RGGVRCPHCGDTRAVNMTRYPAPLGGHAYRVRCGACGRRFRLRFESRRHLRIPTHLPGWLVPAAPQAAAAAERPTLGDPAITITSLSTGGIGFRTQLPGSYTVGARSHVLFVLPDTPQTLISEDIIICRSEAQGGGAAFCRPPGSNPALDWYIYVTSTGAAAPGAQAPVPGRLAGARGPR